MMSDGTTPVLPRPAPLMVPPPPSASSVSAANASHTSWMKKFVDVSLPGEVLAACKPLFCELCQASMNAPTQSASHYEGIKHEKQVRKFLKEMGRPMPADAGPPSAKKAKTGSSAPPACGTCEPCGVALTSQIQAEQHYQGRNHQRKANGLAPLKDGYFNDHSGKWQRHPPSLETAYTTGGPPAAAAPASNAPGMVLGSLQCTLCGVSATSQSQLDMHLNGKSHNAKIKQSEQGMEPHPSAKKQKKPSESAAAVCSPELSIYRTPSGQFYCSPCNLSVNSESQFVQHRSSKKHKLKEASSKPAPSFNEGPPPKKPRGPIIAESIKKY